MPPTAIPESPLPSRRPRVSVFLALSLDGMIADAGHRLDWLAPYASDSPRDTGYQALMEDCDTVLLGRRTYETVRGFRPWPYPDKRVVVLTHRPGDVDQPADAVEGRLGDVLTALAQQGSRRVYLDGGDVVRQALREHRVGELTLSWVPVVLGRGIRWWDKELPLSRWTVQHTRALPSGLVQVRYTPGLAA